MLIRARDNPGRRRYVIVHKLYDAEIKPTNRTGVRLNRGSPPPPVLRRPVRARRTAPAGDDADGLAGRAAETSSWEKRRERRTGASCSCGRAVPAVFRRDRGGGGPRSVGRAPRSPSPREFSKPSRVRRTTPPPAATISFRFSRSPRETTRPVSDANGPARVYPVKTRTRPSRIVFTFSAPDRRETPVNQTPIHAGARVHAVAARRFINRRFCGFNRVREPSAKRSNV